MLDVTMSATVRHGTETRERNGLIRYNMRLNIVLCQIRVLGINHNVVRTTSFPRKLCPAFQWYQTLSNHSCTVGYQSTFSLPHGELMHRLNRTALSSWWQG